MAKKRKARMPATKRAAARKAKAAPRKVKKAAKKIVKKPARKKRAGAQTRAGSSVASLVQTEIVDVVEEIAPGVVKVTEIERVGIAIPDSGDEDDD